jgi:hypothetical protein
MVLVSEERLEAIEKRQVEILNMLSGKSTPKPEKSISHKQAAAFLNIHRNTLTQRIKEGVYPLSIVHINGSKREYYESELSALLNKNK